MAMARGVVQDGRIGGRLVKFYGLKAGYARKANITPGGQRRAEATTDHVVVPRSAAAGVDE